MEAWEIFWSKIDDLIAAYFHPLSPGDVAFLSQNYKVLSKGIQPAAHQKKIRWSHDFCYDRNNERDRSKSISSVLFFFWAPAALCTFLGSLFTLASWYRNFYTISSGRLYTLNCSTVLRILFPLLNLLQCLVDRRCSAFEESPTLINVSLVIEMKRENKSIKWFAFKLYLIYWFHNLSLIT